MIGGAFERPPNVSEARGFDSDARREVRMAERIPRVGLVAATGPSECVDARCNEGSMRMRL